MMVVTRIVFVEMMMLVLVGVTVVAMVVFVLIGVAVFAVMMFVLVGVAVITMMVFMLVGMAVVTVMMLVLGFVRLVRRVVGPGGAGERKNGSQEQCCGQTMDHFFFLGWVTKRDRNRISQPLGGFHRSSSVADPHSCTRSEVKTPLGW